jgi:hypothetical protein
VTRELTEDEKKKYAKPSKITYYDSGITSTYKYVVPKEKGIKIKVAKVQGEIKEDEFKAQQDSLPEKNEEKDMPTGTDELDTAEGLNEINVEVGSETLEEGK